MKNAFHFSFPHPVTRLLPNSETLSNTSGHFLPEQGWHGARALCTTSQLKPSLEISFPKGSILVIDLSSNSASVIYWLDIDFEFLTFSDPQFLYL